MSTQKLTGYLVTIHNISYIPFIKKNGPLLSKISVTTDIYDNLKKLGFDIRIKEDVYTQVPTVSPQDEVADSVTRKPIEKPVVVIPTEVTEPVVSEPNTIVTSVEKSSDKTIVTEDEATLQAKQIASLVQESTENKEEPTSTEPDAATEAAGEELGIDVPSIEELEAMDKDQVVALLTTLNAASEGALNELAPFEDKELETLVTAVKGIFY